ncbi:MAG: extradiol ring-cleavage dioxygenase [Chloroflexota bacterium]
MNQIAFACIAPHGWLVSPLISGPASPTTTKSVAALEELGRRMQEFQPETIVIITPHGLSADGMIPLLDSPIVRGETGRIQFMGGANHSFALECTVDRELNQAIADNASAINTPVIRINTGFDWIMLELDYGVLVPLWLMGAMFASQPQVVVASVQPSISRKHCVNLGQSIAHAASKLGRRVGIIASADLAHTLHQDGPWGFDPAAAECDEAVLDAVRSDKLEALLEFDPVWVDKAKSEAVEPLLTLYGAIKELEYQSEILAYEAPTYFGLLSAAYTIGS